MDRGKIIKGINICLQRFHCGEDCPYHEIGCIEQLRKDVLELLKEEPIASVVRQEMNEYTSDIEQKYFCGACQYAVFESEKYCANCGRKVKWE